MSDGDVIRDKKTLMSAVDKLITKAYYGDMTLVQIYEVLKVKVTRLKDEIADHND